ncbi:MAG TPA: VWA domain-containing protein [Chloroflexi bacterium]|nr:VWA domain-containing protein [Chloroflexota bacterium]
MQPTRLVRQRLIVILLIAFIAQMLTPSALSAQPLEPPLPLPRPLPPPLPPIIEVAPLNQIVIDQHTVDALVEGQVAQVQVTQVLRNQSGSVAEGVYIFPLPKDAAVGDFQITVDGQVLEGRLLDRDEARRIYEQIVRSQRDPALLEYLDRGLFQTSVFPIPPGATRTVTLTYIHPVAREGDLYRFNYPLSMRGYGAATAQAVNLRIELRDLPGLRTIYSPNYPITIERTADDAAVITYAADGAAPAADFDLYFGAAQELVGLNLLSYKPAGEDGFFVLLAAPALDAVADQVVARDIVVVLDVSGSMQGKKIAQATAAVRAIVEQLNPQDRFNLLTFSTGVSQWERRLQPVTTQSQDAALAWLARTRATGSTDINRALLAALAQLDAPDADRPAYILFLTDGQPTQGETDADAIIRNAQQNLPADRTPRLFTFGVGYDVNTDLLDTLAAELRGLSQYVTPDQAIDEAVSAFYAKVSTPVMSDIEIDFGEDVVIDDVFPYPLPDLFAGEQLVVVGRYRQGGAVEVTLTGEVNGAERMAVYPQRVLAEQGGEPFVARLWATRKIGHLLAEIRRNGPDPELIEAITDLSLQYGVVTPYTSYLVLEPEMIPTTPAGEIILPQMRIDADELYSRGAAAATDLAAAPEAGASAVAASQERIALQQAQTVSANSGELRYVAGRTFMLRTYLIDADGVTRALWVDTAYDDAMELTTVEFGSDAYFALLDDPALAQWLALSPELIVVTGAKTALRITVTQQE